MEIALLIISFLPWLVAATICALLIKAGLSKLPTMEVFSRSVSGHSSSYEYWQELRRIAPGISLIGMGLAGLMVSTYFLWQVVLPAIFIAWLISRSSANND